MRYWPVIKSLSKIRKEAVNCKMPFFWHLKDAYIEHLYIRNEELLDEVVRGLRTYFNKALGTMLLYRQERHQYADIRKQHPDKDLVELYGAEHLLRLFGQCRFLIMNVDLIANL